MKRKNLLAWIVVLTLLCAVPVRANPISVSPHQKGVIYLDNCTTDLPTAVSAASTTPTTISLGAGNWPITAAVTIPNNVNLRVDRGAILSIANGATLTINGGLEAGLYQIFSCTGSSKVVFGDATHPPMVRDLMVEWWGATADGSTDNYAAIQAAIVAATSCTAIGSTYPRPGIKFGPGPYAVASCINGTNRTGLVMRGVGGGIQRGTIILGSTGAGKPILDISGSPGAHIEGITLQGDTSTIGLLTSKTTANGCNNQVFRDVNIYMASAPTANNNLGTAGVICKSAENLTFDHVNIYADIPVVLSNTTALSFIASPGANTFTVASDYATVAAGSQGVATFSGDCSLIGYQTRPAVALFDANTVDLGNAYLGNTGTAAACYTALYVRNCDNLAWHGHAEGYNTLMEVPGNLHNARAHVMMTPGTMVTELLNLNPYNPGVAGGELSGCDISVIMPAGTVAGSVASSTDATHPTFIDNITITVSPWAIGDIGTIAPGANLLAKLRNFTVQVLGGTRRYDGTGLWTPVVYGSTTAGVGTYVNQVGRYAVSGNLVVATAYIQWSAHTGTGDLLVSGLPYA